MSDTQRMTINRRRSQRAAVSMPATVVTMSAYQYFEVLDLSATGCRLVGSALPPRGKTALFRLSGFEALCTVVWTKDEMCGVQFEEFVPPAVLKQLRDSGTMASLAVVAS
jgi:hypothetical protein